MPISVALNSTALVCSIADLYFGPLDGCINSAYAPIHLHLCISQMSGFGETMCWHAISVLLIHHCISKLL